MTPFDQWLTNQERYRMDEYDPLCPKCGAPCSDHTPIQVEDEEGNDYETMQCPQSDTGSTFARDNDPVFEQIEL